MKEKIKVVTIDGPSGAGKSTVAKMVAAALGWSYLDTGAMYRAVGLKADREGIALDDDERLRALCADTEIRLSPGGEGDTMIKLDGEDISKKIREHRVSDLASRVSARKPVREAMAAFQREIGESTPTVAEGRDMGTVVFNDAILKIFLTASADTRAKRRYEELQKRGEEVEFEKLLADIVTRDANDSGREHSPLAAASDAIKVDSSEITATQVVQKIVSLLPPEANR